MKPKHHGPPNVGDEYENTEEMRRVLDVVRMGKHQYMVRYMSFRGYPERRAVGTAMCSGTEWSRFLERIRRADDQRR